MLSKPCGREGCTELVTARSAYILKRKRYHSIACQVAAKRAAGWLPHRHLNHENRRRGGLASARRTFEMQRRAALERAVREAADLVPKGFDVALSARALALVKVMLGKAFERGRQWEHRRLEQRRRLQERKGAAA